MSEQDATLDDFTGKDEDTGLQDDESLLPEVGEIPDDWKLTTLEGVAQKLIGGGTPSKSKEEYWGGSIPWASVKDLGDIELTEPEDYITEAGAENSATNIAPAGSVIVSTRMTVGEPFINTVDMAINQDMKAIIPDLEQVNPLFLAYSLWDKDPYLKSLGRGTTVDGITTQDLANTHLGLPPLDEQRKIASILYNTDQGIRQTERVSTQVQRVKKALAQELFHSGIRSAETKTAWMGEIPSQWSVREFSEIVEFSQNGIYKTKDDYGGPYPIIKMGDIFGGVVLDEPIDERVHLDDDELDKYGTSEGDLVFARHAQAGWGAGDCTYVPKMDEIAVIESNMIHVRLTDDVEPKFYAQYFNSEIGVKSLKRITTTGNIKSISQGDLMKLKVPVPPQNQQQKIAKILSVFDKQANTSESELSHLRRLKQGLMRELFSGNVRTNDTNIEVLPEVEQYG